MVRGRTFQGEVTLRIKGCWLPSSASNLLTAKMAFSLGVFFLLCGISGVFGNCPSDWKEYESRCYMYEVNPNNFDAAEQFCSSALTGAHLVSISSEEEQRSVADLIFEKAGVKTTHTWIGLRESVPGGSFAWTDGATNLVYAKFADRQPSGPRGTEDCAYIEGTNEEWYDNDCKVMNPFVCEGPKPQP
ncbi:snaclec 3-like [Nerophis lumbriciformis]|uniref:snaclec 3-like n=1 Tax=Nerophis lumbriciformis TaxID=546530 RepID=UPI003BACF54B